MKKFVVLIVCITLIGCGSAEDSEPYRLRQLDAAGNTWYISDSDPTAWVYLTCEKIGREVAEVTLANKSASEATVRCE